MIEPPGKPGIALYLSTKSAKKDTYGAKAAARHFVASAATRPAIARGIFRLALDRQKANGPRGDFASCLGDEGHEGMEKLHGHLGDFPLRVRRALGNPYVLGKPRN